jgi:hypothetical protein
MRREFFTNADFQSLKGTWWLARSTQENGVEIETIRGLVDFLAVKGNPHQFLMREFRTQNSNSQHHNPQFSAEFLYAARTGGIQIKRARPILAEPPRLMHDLVFAPNGHGLVASSTYNCALESYALTFRLASANLIEMHQSVQGLQKSQIIKSELRR